MRMSDWSSDVCSSDLPSTREAPVSQPDGYDPQEHAEQAEAVRAVAREALDRDADWAALAQAGLPGQIGRASCRERVCPDVMISVVAVWFKKKYYTPDSNLLPIAELHHKYLTTL